jgi:hypothetical protein
MLISTACNNTDSKEFWNRRTTSPAEDFN